MKAIRLTANSRSAVASAPAAFRVRVWEVMSRGRGPRGGCPPPDGVDVACPHVPL